MPPSSKPGFRFPSQGCLPGDAEELDVFRGASQFLGSQPKAVRLCPVHLRGDDGWGAAEAGARPSSGVAGKVDPPRSGGET